MKEISQPPPEYTPSSEVMPLPPSYDVPTSHSRSSTAHRQPPPYQSHLEVDDTRIGFIAEEDFQETIIQMEQQELPGYSPSRSLLGMRILMKSIRARPSEDSFCKTVYQFPDEEVPTWYAPLDNLSPGYIEAIQECNQALRVLSSRKKWVLLYRVTIGLALLLLVWVLVLTIDIRFRPVMIGILFPIIFIALFSAVRVAEWIVKYRSPVPRLRERFLHMGWTLEGFEESQKSVHILPEIIVTRYVVPVRSGRGMVALPVPE
jgi:hypothetical protein